jgi:aspartyl-tRNA(Asn)/glutamyl-tRNA(Gln) amidotransferase subunit C
MKVTQQDVAYVAELANLELPDDERARMLRDMNQILEYVGRLNQLDTTGVEPMAQTSDRYGMDEPKTGSARFAYALREDVTAPSLDRETVMKNAPATDGQFFKVPKVIDK